MQAGEVEAIGGEIPVAGVFEVILVDGVVDDPLQVALRVAYLELDFEVVVSAPTPGGCGFPSFLSLSNRNVILAPNSHTQESRLT